MANWATATDVAQLTGKVVQDSDVMMAQSVIEVTSGGRISAMDTTSLSARNLDWLRRAVAYQAAFMVEFPDYFTRMDMMEMSQDGASATARTPDTFVLAPLAVRCMKRFSWRGMRTIVPSINRTVDRAGYRNSNAPDLPDVQNAPYTSSIRDDNLDWSPM